MAGVMAKRRGRTLECARERLDALMVEYDMYISRCRFIRMPEVFEYIVNRPCARFWVSEIRASVVISNMIKGFINPNMHPSKREMYDEIYRRVLRLRDAFPNLSLFRLVSKAIRQPAPKFYLSPSSAKIMIYKYRKEWYERKRQKRLR